MNRFLHTSIRLNTDLGRATRFFSQADQLSRWFCTGADASPDKSALTLSGIMDTDDRWEWRFTEIVREKHINAQCSDFFQADKNIWFPVEFQLMKCTSLTEYCTEVHVIQRGFDDSEAGIALRASYEELWRNKLEALRSLVNGKWFIEDKDLTLDILK